MNVSQDMNRVERWTDSHHPLWLDFVRIGLGLFILAKGIMFIQNTDALLHILRTSRFEWVSLGLAHYVAFSHLFGGLLITLGLLTRVAILFQIPILLGAVIFVNSQRGFYVENTELWLSLLVLGLLIFFLIFGSGRFSLDHYMKVHKEGTY
ncbi:DoxX family membrane protein [Pontibacter liquoris]|uniref:DoxX family membrane protein n=1 Tax=Pontibacter liquoris TaxID=2905677 RepID=UPI001FA7F08B|nr:DoxX family membrane protein [Pontibacter liquoris]